MKSASAVIIGAGVMGASVAYHLAVRGWRNIVLLDRSEGPGHGSTGAATGGFRAQYATAINVRLSLLARQKLHRFKEETGTDPGYLPAGYLWLASTPVELEELRAGLEVQRDAGLHEAVEVNVDDARRLNPAVRCDGVIGGAFCPTDGFIAPMEILRGYLDAAARYGAHAEWKSEVRGLRRLGDRITSVETDQGRIDADVVINAAGAWAGVVAGWADVALPVTPLRRQVAATVPCDRLPRNMPMTIFAGDGFHFRVRDERVLLLWPSPGVPGGPFELGVDAGWISAVTRMAHERVPTLQDVPVDTAASWAGLYEMSPDKHAILGRAPGTDNFYLINGSSGHGVMHAPALGELLAELVSDDRFSSLDATALRPSRFAEGAANPASGLL